MRSGSVVAVALSGGHTFSKTSQDEIRLVAGQGVEGDAHMGTAVKHRSRVARDASQPNLRQVHLVPEELHVELNARGFAVAPGDMGENITTSGIELFAMPTGTRLNLGHNAVVEITGLRNPCVQLDHFQQGLMAAVLDRHDGGRLIRKAGVMAIVITGGEVHSGDEISVELPAEPYRALEPV